MRPYIYPGCEFLGLCLPNLLRAYSAGLKNTVSADCCEKKILFWQDVNSDFVTWLATRQSASQPAEHGLRPATPEGQQRKTHRVFLHSRDGAYT